MYVQKFPEELIALQREIVNHHPILGNSLFNSDDWIISVATYCEVVVDGYYDTPELIKLCGILTEKLMKMRTINVIQ